MFQKNASASLKNLETQVGQLALNVPNQSKGTFPSDTQKNPKDCMAIQLRSGKDLSSNKETEAEKEKTEEKKEKNSQLEQLNGSNDQKKKKGVLAYTPAVPFPQRLQKSRREEQFSKFLDIFKKIEINIPFAEVISQMPLYAKFLKEVLSKKRKIAKEGIVNLTATCSAIIQQKLPAKMKDPGSFTIPCSIGKYEFKKALCDSGASTNLMSLLVVQRLSLGELTLTAITLQMVDRSMARLEGILKDVLVKVWKFVFPVDFVVMQMEEDTQVPLLLGRPFLATRAALIDVQKGELTLRVGDEAVQFNINRSLEHPNVESDSCMAVRNTSLLNDELNSDCIIQHSINEIEMNFQYLESFDCEVLPSNLFNKETVSSINEKEQQTHEKETSAEGLTLKELPSHLKYEFLEPEKRKPVIILAALTEAEEQKLLVIVRKYKEAIAWSIEDLKGINPSICMHKILLEYNSKTSIEHQRRLNPMMKEIVRKEVLKWLNAGFIYAISDSSWVSPVHVVPKKGGFTVIRNKKNELISTRTVTGWRVCIDYRKLNTATRKDHFPLPFIDQMVDRLAGHPHFCFLDGYFGYNQIAIAPEDQEKTTFTCPFGTFSFRRIPFGLCNAPGTFQRCMMSIFSDLAEEVMEIFMDDFTVYGSSFEQCLHNLGTVLQRCEDKNLA